MSHFPDQIDLMVLDQRQMECLASPIRNEVFWSFTPDVGRSVSDVAEEIGKSAQTIHYHLSELLAANLLISVDERKKHARVEHLYVWAAADVIQQGPTAPREYRDQSVKSFTAVTRSMVREVEDLQNAVDVDPEIFQTAGFRHRTVELTWQQAVELKQRIQDFIDTLSAQEPSEETIRLHVVAFAAPTRGASRRFVERKSEKGKKNPQKDP